MKIVAASTFTAATIIFHDAHAASAAVTDKGEKIFDANCAACHAAGKKLDSKEMSLQKDDLLRGPGLDQTTIENYLKEEFPHKYMPFKLSPQQYTQVTSYVIDNALNDKWPEKQSKHKHYLSTNRIQWQSRIV
jgi:cytochrome c6